MPARYRDSGGEGNPGGGAALFARGLMTLSDILAARETKRLEERDRQALDAYRAEQKADRERQFGLQEKQVNAQIADRESRTAEGKKKETDESTRQARVAELQAQYVQNPHPLLAAQIKDLGGNVPEAPAKEKADIRQAKDGSWWNFTDPTKPVRVLAAPPDTSAAAAPKPTDDPKLPQGVQDWILSTKGRDISAAEIAIQRQQHPSLDARQVAAFKKIVEEGVGIGDAAPAAGPSGVPAPAVSPVATPPAAPGRVPMVGGDQMSVAPSAAPPMSVAPVTPPRVGGGGEPPPVPDELITAALAEAGWPDNPTNRAEAAKRLQAAAAQAPVATPPAPPAQAWAPPPTRPTGDWLRGGTQ